MAKKKPREGARAKDKKTGDVYIYDADAGRYVKEADYQSPLARQAKRAKAKRPAERPSGTAGAQKEGIKKARKPVRTFGQADVSRRPPRPSGDPGEGMIWVFRDGKWYKAQKPK